jgi:hypothetical protein
MFADENFSDNCPYGTYWNYDSKKCSTCAPGTVYDSNLSECISRSQDRNQQYGAQDQSIYGYREVTTKPAVVESIWSFFTSMFSSSEQFNSGPVTCSSDKHFDINTGECIDNIKDHQDANVVDSASWKKDTNIMRGPDEMSVPSCLKDEDCMNLDEYESTGVHLVYACPGSKCTSGKCACSNGCQRDSYTGSCCQGFKEINGKKYCIENTARPEPTLRPNFLKQTGSSNSPNNADDFYWSDNLDFGHMKV